MGGTCGTVPVQGTHLCPTPLPGGGERALHKGRDPGRSRGCLGPSTPGPRCGRWSSSVPSAGVGDNDKPSSSVTAAMRLPGTVRWEVPSLHETSAATSVSFRPVPQSSVRGRLSRPRGWAHGHDVPCCSELPGAPVLLCSPVLSALCSSSLHGTSSLVTSASDPQHPTCLFSKLDEDVCSHGA